MRSLALTFILHKASENSSFVGVVLSLENIDIEDAAPQYPRPADAEPEACRCFLTS